MPDPELDPANRPIRLAAPAGVGPFLVTRFAGTEGLGRLFEYDLELLSDDHEVDFNKVMARPVSLTIVGDEDRPEKFVHGFISRFTQTEARGRHMEYLVTVVPFVWFLTRTADCRIFQDKTVPEIVRKVMSDRGFDDVEDRLRGKYPAWEYCVQYRETDWNFVSRLLEQEGIYYFFEHTHDEQDGNAKHTLVLCDSPSNHEPGKGCAVLPFGRVLSGAQHVDTVSDWAVMNHVHSDQASLIDFNFKKPKNQLRSNMFEAPDYPPPPGEIFDYPGGYTEAADGDRLAEVRAQQLALRRVVFRGVTDARGLSAGVQFELDGHPREDQNRNYLVMSSTHSGWSDVGESAGGGGAGGGSGGELYTCSFEAIDAATQFRPLRTTQKPLIQGPQTAMVVGPEGEEIHTDEFGRVRVFFHWDRAGDPSKGDTSCFIRVAQVWAGKKWGAMYIPRVGHEVIVEFLEGDPDRPIVTGRVYNGEAKPPYDLPAKKTVSTIKSMSSKGGGGFNELRFEDMKGCEQVFINAERNMDVRTKASLFETVGGQRHERTGGDWISFANKNRHMVINEDAIAQISGNASLIVKKFCGLGVEQGMDISVTEGFELSIGGDRKEAVKGAYSLSGQSIVIEGLTKISLKVGGSSVVVDQTGVTIKGSMVTLDGACIKIASGPGSPPDAAASPSEATFPEPKVALEADHADPGESLEINRKRSLVDPPPKPPPLPIPPPDPAKKTFVEFQVLDSAGKPLKDEDAVIIMPSGEGRKLKTDSQGKVRIDGVDPGIFLLKLPKRADGGWSFVRIDAGS